MKHSKINCTITVLCSVFCLSQPMALAQPPIEKGIDSWLRSNSNEMAVGLKQWMGSYKGVKKTGNVYSAKFTKGSLPIKMITKGIDVGCPQTAEPLSKAPEKLRKIFAAKCPGLKP
jgi:hypothetical protein